MKRLANLRPRERRLLLVASVIGLCWAVVAWVVQPLWDQTHDLASSVELAREKVDALSRLLDQAPSVNRKYRALAAYMSAETEGNGEGLRASFLKELEGLSRESNLQLGFKPRAPKQDERLSRFEVELDVEGNQQRLLAFLDALLGMERLVVFERLRIFSVPARHDLLRANIVIQHLILQ